MGGLLRLAIVALTLSATVALPTNIQAQESGLIVSALDFKGNHALDATVLAAAIATTNSGWFARSKLVRWLGLGAKRRFAEQEFRRDVARLRLFYQINGYLDVKVDTTVVRTDRDVYITFRITEGEPARVTRLDVSGLDSLPEGEKILQDLPLKVGAPFNRTLLATTGDTIADRLHDRGFPTAAVFLKGRQVNREARTAELDLQVSLGAPAVIGSVRVGGTNRVDTSFVRSLLATAPGRMYRAQDLFQSQRNLYRTELFRFASVTIDTSIFRPGSGTVPLVVQVTEGPFHRARGSVGYGSSDCFRGGLGWTARNFAGSGWVLDVGGQVSKVGAGKPFDFGAERSWLCSQLKQDSIGSSHANYNLTTSMRRPAFLSPDNTIALSLFAERASEFKVYLREDIGGSVSLTRETQSRTPLTFTYRLAYGSTTANSVIFCAFFNACTSSDIDNLKRKRLLATLGATAIRQRSNNLLDPSRGSVLSAEVTHSSRFIGSSQLSQFTRLVGDAAWYRPLSGNIVFSWHVRAGVIFAPQVSITQGAANFVPPEQRFYGGGPNDVRGYDRNELGPVVYVVPDSLVVRGTGGTVTVADKDVRVAATGGNTTVVGNVELRVPSPIFGNRMRLAAFVDAGGVWERGDPGSSAAVIRVTPGIGIRLGTALGPARLDVAYNPYPLERGTLYGSHSNGDLVVLREGYRIGEGRAHRYTFHFTIGQAF